MDESLTLIFVNPPGQRQKFFLFEERLLAIVMNFLYSAIESLFLHQYSSDSFLVITVEVGNRENYPDQLEGHLPDYIKNNHIFGNTNAIFNISLI